jgi:hypothetical protein
MSAHAYSNGLVSSSTKASSHNDTATTTESESSNTPIDTPSSHSGSNWQDISIGKGFHASNGHEYGAEEGTVHCEEKSLPGGGNWVVQKYGGTSSM